MRRFIYKRTLATVLVAIIVLGTTLIYYSYSKPRTPIAFFRYVETITVANNGTKPITFDGISIEAFLNFSWQISRVEYVSQSYEFSQDKDGNPILLIDGPSELAPNETFEVMIRWKIESFPREQPEISIKESGSLSDIPPSLVNYTREVGPWKSPPDILLDTESWSETEYYNLSLKAVAFKLKGGSDNVLEILLNDVDWIATYIQYHSADPTYPVETARNRKGDCDDQSNLLIALLRAQGIPAFLMMGQVYLPQRAYENVTGTTMNGHLTYVAKHTFGHAWAMVYVPPWGWLPCDPVVASRGDPSQAITAAMAREPMTLVFKNVTGIHELEEADYIGSSREETRKAEEEGIYYWLTLDMQQVPIPSQELLLQSKVLVLFAEAVFFASLTVIALIYDKRKARPPLAILGRIYCMYCGARNPYEAVYCGNCGRRLRR